MRSPRFRTKACSRLRNRKTVTGDAGTILIFYMRWPWGSEEGSYSAEPPGFEIVPVFFEFS
jgi:hypothetical protein